MQALDVPANGLLFLHAAGPIEVRPAEEILEGDPVRNVGDSAKEDDQRGKDQGNDHEFHGFHQVAFCR